MDEDGCFGSMVRLFANMGDGKKCCTVSLCVVLVSVVVYVAVALEGVEPTEYALIRNNLSQQIDETTVLDSGLHFVGVFYSLIKFPQIHKTIEYSDDASAIDGPLRTRTIEGLDLTIHCAFQYQLDNKTLPKMYRLVAEDYESVYRRVARNAILEVASTFKAPDYWTKRKDIGEKMKEQLSKSLEQANAHVTGFMLLKIDLPDQYEDAIVRTQVTSQEMLTKNELRSVQTTQQMTDNIVSAADARIVIINSQAQAEADGKTWAGRGNITQANFNYTSRGLKAVNDELKFQDVKASLMQYYYMQRIGMMDTNTNNKLLVGKMTTTVLTGDML